MGRLGSGHYYNGIDILLENVVSRSLHDIPRWESVIEQAKAENNKSVVATAEVHLKSVKLQYAKLEKIANILIQMDQATEDKQITALGKQAMEVVNTLVVQNSSSSYKWQLTSQVKHALSMGINNCTGALRTELIRKKEEQAKQEKKENSPLRKLFNKKSKNEQQADQMVEAMANNQMDTQGNIIDYRRPEETDIARKMGFIKVGVLGILTAVICIAVVVVGIILLK